MYKTLNLFVNKINNSLKKKHKTINFEYSIILYEILNVLETSGFIKGFKIIENSFNKEKQIIVFLKYANTNNSVINSIQQVSTTKQKVFLKKQFLVFSNLNSEIFIVSTNKGILTSVDAIKNNVGGEVILKIS
jgi:small subunit ribosomal protein S8